MHDTGLLNKLATARARQILRRNPWCELPDLVNEAWLAIYDAQRWYKPEIGPFEPYAKVAIDRRLTNYTRWLRRPVSTPFAHKVQLTTEEFESAEDLADTNHLEKIYAEAELATHVRIVINNRLRNKRDAGLMVRVLVGNASVSKEITNEGERDRLWKSLSRLRKELRTDPELQYLFKQIKELANED